MKLVVREELDKDHAAVHRVNSSAFETAAEANLVDALRAQASPIISLVAETADGIVGHILFSPITSEGGVVTAIMGLAPMAVLPGHQRKGIGTALVNAGIEQCKKLGVSAVVVLGHPEYYPRFGFTPAASFGISSEYDVPAEVFMALELEPGYLQKWPGQVKYHPQFAAV